MSSTSNATVSWTVPKVVYTPENYTVYYALDGNCLFSDSGLQGLNSSIPTYTPNNQTLTSFYYLKDVEFSVELFGMTPSTSYCCVVVARNTNGSTESEVLSFETKTDSKQM